MDRRTSQSLSALFVWKTIDGFRCLISSGARRFSSRWWKYLLWLGSSLVLLGFCLLVVAFALPRKAIDVNADSPSSPSSVIIIDRQALNYNAHLDASRLLGIAFVVGGGIFFAFALLLPTFCHVWCASGDATDETDPLKVNDGEGIMRGCFSHSVSFSLQWRLRTMTRVSQWEK